MVPVILYRMAGTIRFIERDYLKTLAVIVLRGKRSAVESCVEFPCIIISSYSSYIFTINYKISSFYCVTFYCCTLQYPHS